VDKDQRNSLSGLQVFRPTLTGALVSHDVKTDFLAIFERGHSGALDSGDVNEHVSLSITLLDEAETLGMVEKLYCSCGHGDFLSILHRRLHAAQDAQQSVQIDFEKRRPPKPRFASETNF
jgi:hypothetical protein